MAQMTTAPAKDEALRYSSANTEDHPPRSQRGGCFFGCGARDGAEEQGVDFFLIQLYGLGKERRSEKGRCVLRFRAGPARKGGPEK